MKKSNKLLLGGFLTLLLLIAGIHIALFAKYKNGNYTIYHPEDNRGEKMQSFPNVSFVTFRGVRDATIQFGETAEAEKAPADFIKYVQKGDSLIISGNDRGDIRRQLNFTLPYNVTLSAFNSFFTFETREKSAEINPVIFLENSHAFFVPTRKPFLLGHVKVVASNMSIVAFQGNTQVNNLEVQLSNSALEYNKGDAGQLSIVTDSISRLSLQSKHLIKAKITTVPNNP
jgi:hypothetical protein